MEQLKKWSILSHLLQGLKEKGSWCGATHLQKATYLLQELGGVDLGLRFVLYKHGPFSFDLRDEAKTMRARGIIDRKIQPRPYGPSLFVTESGWSVLRRIDELEPAITRGIEFVTEQLKDHGVAELERVSTALFILRSHSEDPGSAEGRAEEMVKLKPHIEHDSALTAVKQASELLQAAQVELYD